MGKKYKLVYHKGKLRVKNRLPRKLKKWLKKQQQITGICVINSPINRFENIIINEIARIAIQTEDLILKSRKQMAEFKQFKNLKTITINDQKILN